MVKPEFITEPEDRFVLPKSLWANLLCEARFVSNLNFHCTGGLPQREIHYNQTGNPVKLLIVEITLKNNATDAVCTCVASGYKGQVIKSRPAAIRKACKWIYVISNVLFCVFFYFVRIKGPIVSCTCRTYEKNLTVWCVTSEVCSSLMSNSHWFYKAQDKIVLLIFLFLLLFCFVFCWFAVHF